MDSEIRAIMAQYMPLDSQNEVQSHVNEGHAWNRYRHATRYPRWSPNVAKLALQMENIVRNYSCEKLDEVADSDSFAFCFWYRNWK